MRALGWRALPPAAPTPQARARRALALAPGWRGGARISWRGGARRPTPGALFCLYFELLLFINCRAARVVALCVRAAPRCIAPRHLQHAMQQVDPNQSMNWATKSLSGLGWLSKLTPWKAQVLQRGARRATRAKRRACAKSWPAPGGRAASHYTSLPPTHPHAHTLTRSHLASPQHQCHCVEPFAPTNTRTHARTHAHTHTRTVTRL